MEETNQGECVDNVCSNVCVNVGPKYENKIKILKHMKVGFFLTSKYKDNNFFLLWRRLVSSFTDFFNVKNVFVFSSNIDLENWLRKSLENLCFSIIKRHLNNFLICLLIIRSAISHRLTNNRQVHTKHFWGRS